MKNRLAERRKELKLTQKQVALSCDISERQYIRYEVSNQEPTVTVALRLSRALDRERQQSHPQYEEMCRRFLADEKDFCEENLKKCGIGRRYVNADLETCIREIMEDIRGNL